MGPSTLLDQFVMLQGRTFYHTDPEDLNDAQRKELELFNRLRIALAAHKAELQEGDRVFVLNNGRFLEERVSGVVNHGADGVSVYTNRLLETRPMQRIRNPPSALSD